MQEYSFLSELGVGIASLLILWFVVKYFIKTIEHKDVQIEKMVASFNKTINNHIVHQTAAAKKETEALNHLTSAITALIMELKK